jgi:hypothetical protein
MEFLLISTMCDGNAFPEKFAASSQDAASRAQEGALGASRIIVIRMPRSVPGWQMRVVTQFEFVGKGASLHTYQGIALAIP